jgi:hypothetical protein
MHFFKNSKYPRHSSALYTFLNFSHFFKYSSAFTIAYIYYFASGIILTLNSMKSFPKIIMTGVLGLLAITVTVKILSLKNTELL